MLTANYKKSRDESLDVLRGVAILMVLLLHAVVITPNIENYKWIVKIGGHFEHGVQLFFMLSGWLIASTYESGISNGPKQWIYFARRFAKIIPLYLIFMSINIILFLSLNKFFPDLIQYRNSVTASNLNLYNFIRHLFFLQGFFPRDFHTLVDGSWSIVNEVYFYVLYPIVIYRYTKTVYDSLRTFAICILLSITFMLTVGKYYSAPEFGGFSYYAFPVQLPCFILGIFCFRVKNAMTFAVSQKYMNVILLTVVILFFGTAEIKAAPVGAHIISCIIFVPLFIFLEFKGSSIIYAGLRSLGRQSYSLFFLHLVLLKTLVIFLIYYGNLDAIQILGMNVFVSVGISWILSWLLFNRIDNYCVQKVRNATSKYRNSTFRQSI